MKNTKNFKLKFFLSCSQEQFSTEFATGEGLLASLKDSEENSEIKLLPSLVEVQNLSEIKTANFSWPIVVDFYLSNVSSREQLPENMDSYFYAIGCFKDLKCSVGTCLIEEMSYGTCQINDALVTSFYRWNSEASDAERQSAMQEHFEMEKDQPLFHGVRFGTVRSWSSDSNLNYQFIFEGFCKNRSDIDNIYSDEMLERMRMHSRKFLDVSTRELAFGSIREILKQ